jgi:hypothetical protein
MSLFTSMYEDYYKDMVKKNRVAVEGVIGKIKKLIDDGIDKDQAYSSVMTGSKLGSGNAAQIKYEIKFYQPKK